MSHERWVVVKVGGSLYDWPELRGRLQAFLASFRDDNVLIFPGGGLTADAIRLFDQVHELGEEASHWLAIQALSLNARFLQALLPGAGLVGENFADASGSDRALHVLDPLPFFLEDERRDDHLPHRWEVTSDSLAVRAAVLFRARELVLLKSTTWEGSDWFKANEAGVVDAYFATALQQASGLAVRCCNLRGR